MTKTRREARRAVESSRLDDVELSARQRRYSDWTVGLFITGLVMTTVSIFVYAYGATEGTDRHDPSLGRRELSLAAFWDIVNGTNIVDHDLFVWGRIGLASFALDAVVIALALWVGARGRKARPSSSSSSRTASLPLRATGRSSRERP